MEVGYIWIIAGIVCIIAEMFTPGFFMASFGAGAFSAGILAFMIQGVKYQFILFVLVSIMFFFIIRPFWKKAADSNQNSRKTGIDAIIGLEITVTETISESENTGRITIYGESWRAKAQNGKKIEKGVKVIVAKIKGATAYVNEKIE